MEKFDCNRLLKEYALSCIENYLLYLISQKKISMENNIL